MEAKFQRPAKEASQKFIAKEITLPSNERGQQFYYGKNFVFVRDNQKTRILHVVHFEFHLLRHLKTAGGLKLH